MDDIQLNKISIIKNCIKRIHEEYFGHELELESNFTKQDSIILNLQRACEATLDLGMRIIRIKNLGVPQSSREVFALLEKAHYIPHDLSLSLQAMVGFRNIAVHDYQKVNLEIVRSIITSKLSDFDRFIECSLQI